MNKSELMILGVIPILAIVGALVAYSRIRSSRSFALTQTVAMLLLIVGVASTNVDEAFAIQNVASVGADLTRLTLIRAAVALEVLMVFVSVFSAVIFRKRWGCSYAVAVALALLGNIGALIWMARRSGPSEKG